MMAVMSVTADILVIVPAVLGSTVIGAAAVLETEKAVFRERRDSWRPNFLAIGQALLDVVAARADGNWMRGASASARSLREWDAAEGRGSWIACRRQPPR